MAIIKCKMCGGDIEISADKTFGTCEYCGSTMTLPKVDDEQRAAAFNRGNHFRRSGEFDKALAIKDEMVAQSQAYTSYSGAQEGVKTHLKLVYKVEAPKAPVVAQSQAADSPQDAQQPTTFWQRILQLFR